MKFAIVHEHRTHWPVAITCSVLGVSRSGYFAWRRRPVSEQARRREALTRQIRQLHEVSRKAYGSPRMHQMLLGQGIKACVNTVARLMCLAGVAARKRRPFVPRTTDSDAMRHPAANVPERDFAPGPINRRWASDITCIPTQEGWLYLAAVLDLGSRRIVGWSMDATMETTLTLISRAWQKCLANRPLPTLAEESTPPLSPSPKTSSPSLKIADAERELIQAALQRHDGNRTAAAAELGISVRTLYYRLDRYESQDKINQPPPADA